MIFLDSQIHIVIDKPNLLLIDRVMRLERCLYKSLFYVFRVFFFIWYKTCSLCLHSLVKTEANVWENSRADQWSQFHLLENSHKLCRGFHQAMKAQRTCFISCWPFKTHVLSKLFYIKCCENTFVDQSKRTKYPNYLYKVLWKLLLTNQNARTIQNFFISY